MNEIGLFQKKTKFTHGNSSKTKLHLFKFRKVVLDIFEIPRTEDP